MIVAFIGRPEYTLQNDGLSTTASVTSSSILGTFISVAVGVFINYFLYRFAVASIRGVDSMDSVGANQGFNSLRTYFKILGIILIIGLCFMVLAFVFFLVSIGSARRY